MNPGNETILEWVNILNYFGTYLEAYFQSYSILCSMHIGKFPASASKFGFCDQRCVYGVQGEKENEKPK